MKKNALENITEIVTECRNCNKITENLRIEKLEIFEKQIDVNHHVNSCLQMKQNKNIVMSYFQPVTCKYQNN